MNALKPSLALYTQAEFEQVVEELLQAAGTSAWQDRLLEHFIAMVEHPEGSDLLYFPAPGQQLDSGQVVARIVAWRRSKGLSVFSDSS